MKLRVATSQLPVGADVRRNARHVLRQMRSAKRRGADVVHFCEGSLSGYAGRDFPSFAGFDWDALRACTEAVLGEARALRLWVLLGSAHRLSGRHKPHNCVYVIDARGRLVERYDKLFCAGDRRERTIDLAHYTSGSHFCVFRIRGVRCGVLICHDYRYPELYREYKRRGVQLVFHSFHAANASRAEMRALRAYVGARNRRHNPGATLPEITMPATMISQAANNHVWISASNSSAPESAWPAFCVRPDGVVIGRLRRNRAGLLLSEVDTRAGWYDSTAVWRDRVLRGILHSGRLVRDARSRARTRL